MPNLNQRNELRSNEGCYNCGDEESYPGANDPDIRYLCAVCTMCGIVVSGRKAFERLEAEKRSASKPLLRLRRKTKTKVSKPTLANC